VIGDKLEWQDDRVIEATTVATHVYAFIPSLQAGSLGPVAFPSGINKAKYSQYKKEKMLEMLSRIQVIACIPKKDTSKDISLKILDCS
jgi:hypothetical protein